ncbi:MAG: RNA methyltransferase [Dethiobacter sp.]|jgi:TrmH family RNA methyltransferase|nr:MAG: RNA methyltransferase [Dethiobacter sp.]
MGKMYENKWSRDRIIKEYRLLGSRKYRKKSGKIILEGYHLLEEAFKAGAGVEAVLYTDEFMGKAVNRKLLARAGKTRSIKVSTAIFNSIAQTDNPQGIGAIARIPGNEADFAPGDALLFLILDGLQDPGNLGTIIRTAAGAAIDGIFLLPGTVDPYNPKALRATMGGIFHLPVVQMDGISGCHKFLQERDLQLVVADPRGDVPYYHVDFTRPSAIVIGNENRGVQEPLLKKAEVRAYIPLRGKIAALNAAVAASVFMFEYRRQREVKI